MKKVIVITTINGVTEAIAQWADVEGYHVIIAGDRKSLPVQSTEKLTYLSLADQQGLGFTLADSLPIDHYGRKNIGYLYALRHGAEILYETDDDNFPLENWAEPTFSCADILTSQGSFLNIYREFSAEHIWPRGYPLDEIKVHEVNRIRRDEPVMIGAWQGLVDGDPDVDALYRLICAEGEHTFTQGPAQAMEKGAYCPFNSQNTFWHPDACVFLYLPVTVSFRFTDILRGYIAQRLMWHHGMHLGFLSANARQLRNEHDLMRDFRDEIECYLNVKPVVSVLDRLKLTSDPAENLLLVYSSLAGAGLVKEEETDFVKKWVADIGAI